MLKNLSISADEVEKLETFPYSALMKAYCKAARTVGAAINWGPIANDYYVGHPVDVGFTDYAKTVPLIVGTVIAEFGGFRGGISIASTEAEKRAAVEDAFNGPMRSFRSSRKLIQTPIFLCSQNWTLGYVLEQQPS